MKRLDFETSIMNKMKGFLVIIFLSIFGLAEAQSVLTVEDALKIALKNNYGILVASNAAEISKTNNSWGNSGALPSVSLIGNGNLSIQDGKDKSPSGVTTYSGETSKSMSTGVQLSWTLFDGGKMFVYSLGRTSWSSVTANVDEILVLPATIWKLPEEEAK